jgi:hypothetical protein
MHAQGIPSYQRGVTQLSVEITGHGQISLQQLALDGYESICQKVLKQQWAT